jgi:hypothetical protein
VSDLLAHADDDLSLRHARNLTERTLGIRRSLDNYDLYVTDRWFEGDRFERWALEQGSVEKGARAIVRLIERPGFDRRTFRPWDKGRPGRRVAARGDASARNVLNGLLAAPSGGATAKEVIGGLVDAAAGAAALTGPQGFAVGAAVVVFKQLISLGLQDDGDKRAGEDDVSAALRGLGAQVSQLQIQVSELKDQIDEKFLQQQIARASAKVRTVETTQAEFLSMLKWAGEMDDKALLAEERKEARTNLVQRTSSFLSGAHDLADAKDRAADYFNDALMGEKTPGSAPGLISGVREHIGNKRFFTYKSSQEIQNFFRYFEWAQTNLATVLTEFYMLGGTCAKNFMSSHPGQLPTSADCQPVRGVAKEDIERIRDNIAKQGATLPPKILVPGVFIDRDTKIMWRTTPERRMSPEILDKGLFCTKEFVPDCQADLGYGNATVFPTSVYPTTDPWYIPKSFEYRDLFAGRGPDQNEPLARLNSLGVRYQGEPLNGPTYFWLRGDFYLRKLKGPLPSAGWSHVDRIDAIVFKLAPGATSPVGDTWKLGFNCATTASARPTCQSFNQGLGADILWFRRMNDVTEGASYWCRPGRAPSWDPAKC